MNDYHKYVFDVEQRKYVGEFEEMYRAEKEEFFDSWHQEDLRTLSKQFCLAILAQYNFSRILDVGCGKGTFTHLLKRNNNHVVGIDISETALKHARGKFPDIEFFRADLSCTEWSDDNQVLKRDYDLVVLMEILSYLRGWEEVIERLSKITKFLLVSLFIPRNPIGFVKNTEDLVSALQRYFVIVENVQLVNRDTIILFGSSKPVTGGK